MEPFQLKVPFINLVSTVNQTKAHFGSAEGDK